MSRVPAPREGEEQQLHLVRQALRRTLDLYRDASPLTHFTKTTGPILFLTGDLDNADRDKAGLEKLQSLNVPTQQTILKDAKHGCWDAKALV